MTKTVSEHTRGTSWGNCHHEIIEGILGGSAESLYSRWQLRASILLLMCPDVCDGPVRPEMGYVTVGLHPFGSFVFQG